MYLVKTSPIDSPRATKSVSPINTTSSVVALFVMLVVQADALTRISLFSVMIRRAIVLIYDRGINLKGCLPSIPPTNKLTLNKILSLILNQIQAKMSAKSLMKTMLTISPPMTIFPQHGRSVPQDVHRKWPWLNVPCWCSKRDCGQLGGRSVPGNRHKEQLHDAIDQ